MRSSFNARLLAPLAALLLLAACDSVEERIEKHYERGLALVESGEPAKATVEFRNVLELNENHPGARYQIGLAYERDGEIRAALGNYALAAELDPNNLDVRVKLSQFYLLGNNTETAEGYVAQAMALAPDDPDVLAVRAALLFQQEQVDEALLAARAALAQEPGHVSAGMILASARYADGDIAAALEQLDTIIAANPTSVSAHTLKARVLEAEGSPEALLEQIEAMVRQFPDEQLYRQTLVQQLANLGENERAEMELRALVADYPDNVSYPNDLARFVATQRGPEAGRAELVALAEATTDPVRRGQLQVAIAQVDLGLGNTDGVQDRLETVIDDEASGESRNEARLLLARMEEEAGNRAEARALVDAILQGDSSNTDALLLRALLHIEAEAPEAAIMDLRTASSSAPEDVRVMMAMAQAYELNGSPDLAIDRLAAASRVSSYEPRIALVYANALNQQNQANASLTVLQEIVRRHPEEETVLAALAQQHMRLGDWESAQKAAEALAAQQGSDTAMRQVEAMSLMAEGRSAESISLMRDIASETGDASAAVVQLVAALVRTGDMEGAERVIDETLSRNPDAIGARLMRAELTLMRNDVDGTRAILNEIVDTDPDSPAGYASLATLHIGLDERPAAEDILRRGIATATQTDGLRLTLAGLLEQRGEIDGAIEQYQAVYESQPASPLAANNYAALLGQYRADDPEAIERAQRIAQRLRSSTVPEFQDTYGWLQYLSGNYEAALRSLRPASEARPENAWIRFHTGMTFAALDQVEEARLHLEAALAIDPAFPKAEEARATLADLPSAP